MAYKSVLLSLSTAARRCAAVTEAAAPGKEQRSRGQREDEILCA
jgi:hypothetical protein